MKMFLAEGLGEVRRAVETSTAHAPTVVADGSGHMRISCGETVAFHLREAGR